MARLFWTRAALQDIAEIRAYIASDNPAAAGRVAAALRRHASLLREQPRLGRSGLKAGTRELVVPRLPYVIVYRVFESAGSVEILAILHAAQDRPEA